MTSSVPFLALVGAVAVLAGVVASVSGLGIGSLPTLLLVVRVGVRRGTLLGTSGPRSASR
jgi:hypothetical protein